MNDRGLQRLGKYEVLEKIGAGAFADVYKASDTVLERTVALKIPAPFLLRDPGFIERFQREARAAANLKHANLVAIYEMGEIEGVYYIAMEYLPGRTLRDIIKEEGALPLSRALAITEQVVTALQYAHEQGLVHRDVKPSNIIVDEEGLTTLTDFGLVKAVGEATLTSRGAAVGTPEYMSPEQAEGKPVDKRSDIYSLGIVLYQMLTGEVPFSADSTPATLYLQVHESPQRPSELAPGLPKDIEATVLKALEKNPENRHQTAAAFMEALKGVVEAEGEEEAKAQKLKDLYSEAARLASVKDWQGTIALYEQMLALKRSYRDVSALLDKARVELKQEDKRLEEEREHRERRERPEELYAEATQLLADREYEAALARLDEVKAREPEYGDPQGIGSAARRGLEEKRRKLEVAEAARKKRVQPAFFATPGGIGTVAGLAVVCIVGLVWLLGRFGGPPAPLRESPTPFPVDSAARALPKEPSPTMEATPVLAPSPTASTHIVQVGETLAEIADRYGTTAAAIVDANNLADANAIGEGQVLVIPRATAPRGTVSATPTPTPPPTGIPIPVTSTPTAPPPTAAPLLEPVTIVIDWARQVRRETVDAHRPVIVRWRWLVCQPQVVQDHLDALTFEVTIDGRLTATGNMAQHRKEVREEDLYDRHWWVHYWSYPMGAFQSGSFHWFEVEYQLIRSVTDGCDFDGDGHLDMHEAGLHGVTRLEVTVQ